MNMNTIQSVYRTRGFARSERGRWLAWAIAVTAAIHFLKWSVWDAVFSASDDQACRMAAGACWAIITAQWKLVLLGSYPFEEIWRPLVVAAVLVAAFLTAFIKARLGRIALIWTIALFVSATLLDGRVLGLPYVETLQWGGLPLTLLLSLAIMLLSFPLALCVALLRLSDSAILRSIALVIVECVRGVPLVSLLFFATLVVPLFLTGLSHVDKLTAAALAIVVFNAAYISEVMRGGLLTVPSGQFEAAKALGLRWATMQRLVVLPQALKACSPSLVNHLVGIVKDTSLVAVVGIFDLMNSAKLSLVDITWREYHFEVYIMVGITYFLMCAGASLLGERISDVYFRN